MGQPVTIRGENFASTATVAFGSEAAWTVSFVSSTEMTAVAPPGSGVVNVTVTVDGMSSADYSRPSAEQFRYKAVPSPPPAVEVVFPAEALPNAFVNVSGADFDTTSAVYLGGRGALQSDYLSPTDVMAQVPWGVGNVDVQVVDRNGTSLINPGDIFTFDVNASSLPQAVSASPTLLPDPTAPGGAVEGVLATDTATSSTVFYKSLDGGASYRSFLVGQYTTSIGSPLLASLGSTRVFMGGGTPAMTASLSVGSLEFALYTTQLGGRTVVETSASTNGGNNWNGPYPTAPISGTLADPELAASPNGYIYATWLEDGNGTWQLDQAVFAESGQLLYGPDAIPGTSSGTESILSAPSLAVDGWARPVYLWEAINSTTNNTELRSTGAFVSAADVAGDLATAFAQTATQPWDFTVQGTGQSDFISQVNTNLSLVQDVLSSRQICTIQSRVIGLLGPELTTNSLQPVIPGESAYCGVAVPSARTDIVNATGPGSADTYLGVYGAWLAEAVGYAKALEPFWPGAPGSADSNETPPYNPGSPYYAPDALVNVTTQDYQISVQAVTLNPNVLWLHVTGDAPDEYNYSIGAGLCDGNIKDPNYIEYTDTAGSASEAISVTQPNGTATYNIPSGAPWPSPFLTGVSPGTEGNWSITFHWTYTETGQRVSCDQLNGTQFPVSPTTAGLPSQYTVTVSGIFTTVLETIPQGLIVHEVGHPQPDGIASDYIAWNNSLNATANVTVVGSEYSVPIPTPANGTAVLGANTGLFQIPDNHSYTAYANLTSAPGGTNPIWTDQFDTGLDGGVSSMPETASTSCSFYETYDPIDIQWLSTRISGVTTSSATLTWYANTEGLGWASYNATSDGVYTQTARIASSSTNDWGWSQSWEYQVVLNGLSPWNLYRVTVGVSTFAGCLEFDDDVPWEVQTLSLVSPQELDLPYDSITQEGGGARITWTVPSEFAAASHFVNGSITYCQWLDDDCVTNTTVIVPLPNLSALSGGSQFTFYWVNDTFQVNLTALELNANYTLSVLLNYTLANHPFVAQSEAHSFTYQKDTSGDGLTDAEKLRGWNVTWQQDGVFHNQLVRANPDLYSTNGLTNDYIEKELGLNPNTLSSTNDGMLDAWNLTFDLGPISGNSPALPTTGFTYWNESGTYDFADACPDPEHGSTCSFSPGEGGGNLTDDGPGSSEILWNSTGPGSALADLESLIASEHVSPLRAMIGHYGSDRTITVWGKLSWGADPLAYSTSHYESTGGLEVPDGSMVNPLGYSDLNVTIDSWSMDGLSDGDGVATFIYARSNATGSFPDGRVDYSSYSLTSRSTGSVDSYYGTFTVNFPVESNEQSVTLNFSMVANTSSDGHHYVWDNASAICVDLEHTGTNPVAQFSSSSYTLDVTYQVVPVYSKANTVLIVPGDNSTFSFAPIGLQRYTGEQNFILLELNDTVGGSGDTLTSADIPYVNSTATYGVSTGTYSVGLTAGLNNLLVPRSLFNGTPLGQALLNMTFENITGEGYLGGLDQAFEPGYWIARDTGTVFDGINYSLSNSPGGSNDPSGFIKVYSNTNQSCTDPVECGGVPSNPSIEAKAPSYAIGAIFTLNVSSSADLNDLLAGLVLNASGNFTAWAYAATPYLPTLGLSNEVLSALANPVFYNDGGFGVPQYSTPPPPPPQWWDVGAVVWNAVSGVVGLVSAAWNWVTEAASYVAYLADELTTWGLEAISQTLTVLREVAEAINWALNFLLNNVIIPAIEALISPAFDAIKDSLTHFGADLTNAVNYATSTGDISRRGDLAIWTNLSGGVFQLASAFVLVAIISLGLLTGITFGAANILSGIVISLLFALLLSLALPGFEAISAGLAFSGEDIVNQSASQSFQQSTWDTMADALGWWASGYAVGYSGWVIYTAFITGSVPELLDSVAFVIGMLALFVVLAAWNVQSMLLGAVGIVLDLVSLVLDGAAIKKGLNAEDWETKDLDVTTATFDLATFAIDTYKVLS